MKAPGGPYGVKVQLRAFPLLALLLCLQSCSDSKPVPIAPAPRPAEVVDVSPAPLATGIPYDTQIWAEMSLPLDPGTVNDRTVFLKLDTRRVAVDVRWDAPSRRIVIRPLENMALFRTHTVELSPELRLQDGRRFAGYFWQFKTNSLRRLEDPHPAAGTSNCSPFTALTWDSTETSAGSIGYQIYLGADSATVADRAIGPAFATARAYHLPSTRWTSGATYWWAITAENLTTGESVDGPTWRFDVVPAAIPADSVVLTARQWGWIRRVSGDLTFSDCLGPSVPIGSSTVSAIDWDFAGWPTGAAVTGVSLTMTSSGGSLSSVASSIWGTSGSWSACTIGYPGPPYTDMYFGPLASGVLLTGGRMRYESDLLAAHVQSRLTGLPLGGYLLTSSASAAFASPQSPSAGPRLVVWYAVSEPRP